MIVNFTAMIHCTYDLGNQYFIDDLGWLIPEAMSHDLEAKNLNVEIIEAKEAGDE